MYVVFENDGEIDISLVTTFGVSVKQNENPIGYFGTGLKYSTAILMRSSHKLSIYSGLDKYKFGTKVKNIRGKDFTFVTMDDAELSFTTELGKNWDMWQAFRELYCNCLDEGGRVYTSLLPPRAEEGKTKVVVRGSQILGEYHQKDTIVFNPLDKRPVVSGAVDIYDRPSEYMYYRGVRVAKLSKPAIFTYNIIADQELTEDRTFKDSTRSICFAERRTSMIKEAHLVHDLVTAKDDTFEGNINFSTLSWYSDITPSDCFKNYCEKAYKENIDDFNQSAVQYYRKEYDKKASKNFELAELSEVEVKGLMRCIDIVKKAMPHLKTFPVDVVKDLGNLTMAVAVPEERRVKLSRRCFDHGNKFIVSTLIEEFAHLQTGYTDQSRQLQTWLFDELTGMIEKHILKEMI